MTVAEHYLTILKEESVEVAIELVLHLLRINIRTSKALRFGADEVQPGQPFSNSDRILNELYDLQGTIDLCQQAGILPTHSPEFVQAAKDAKIAKILSFMPFAASRGTVDGVTPDSTVPHPEAGTTPKDC